jgi:hypothetical protein
MVDRLSQFRSHPALVNFWTTWWVNAGPISAEALEQGLAEILPPRSVQCSRGFSISSVETWVAIRAMSAAFSGMSAKTSTCGAEESGGA